VRLCVADSDTECEQSGYMQRSDMWFSNNYPPSGITVC